MPKPSTDFKKKYDSVVLLSAGDASTDTMTGTLYRKQIVKYGKWVNPMFPVEQMDLDESFGQSLVDNFKAGIVGKIPVPMDHTDETDANTGEVMDLESVDGDGLYAIMDIRDPDTVQKIEDGLIFDCSISFEWDYEDTKTGNTHGPTLLHVALVNNPYLKGMKPFEQVAQDIQNNLFASSKQNSAIMLSEAKAKELSDMEKATVKNTQKYPVTIKVKDEEGTEVERELAAGEECEIPKDQSEAVLNQINEATAPEGDGDGDNDDDNDDDDDGDGDGDGDGDKPLTDDERKELSDLRKKNAKLALSASYEKLLKAGKITPAQKEKFMALANHSSVKIELSKGKTVSLSAVVAGILEAGPKVVNFDENGSGKGQNTDKLDKDGKPITDDNDEDISEKDRAGMQAVGVTEEQYKETVKKHPELVAASLNSNSEDGEN